MPSEAVIVPLVVADAVYPNTLTVVIAAYAPVHGIDRAPPPTGDAGL